MTRMKREIWHPPDYDINDVRAIQALMLYAKEAETPSPPGEEAVAPSALDCKRALDWIIHHAAATYENGFVANDDHGRIGAFMEGRRFVGQQVIKLAKLKISAVFYGTQKEEFGEND